MCWVKVYTFLRFWIIIATFPSRKAYPLHSGQQYGNINFPTSSTTMKIFLNEKLFLLICEKCSPRWVLGVRGRPSRICLGDILGYASGMFPWHLRSFYILGWVIRKWQELTIFDLRKQSFKSFNLINLFVNWGRSLRLRTGQTANAF